MRASRAAIVASAILVGLVTAPITASAAVSTASATVISTSNSPFGKILVVGSGQYKGYTVYMLTSDDPPSFGCTTTVQQLPPGPIACTGPEGGQSEWPAVTTTAAPVAGPGVKQGLLGSVARTGIGGNQVTYAGHPLYLFDMGAGQVTGEGWDEPGLPPWHGLWYVVSPKGQPIPWAGMITTSTVGGKKVLAVQFETLAGWINFPVYTYSKGPSCTGSCARAWPPLLTSGTPGVSSGLQPSAVGTRTIAGGLHQVTYNGKPLYLYGDETPKFSAQSIVPVGNGKGKKVGKRTFQLVKL